MPKLKVKKPFKWAHRHVDVQEYAPGDVIETDDADLIRVATEEGWATASKASGKSDPTTLDAAKADVHDLEAQLAQADEAAMPALQAQLEKAREALAALPQ